MCSFLSQLALTVENTPARRKFQTSINIIRILCERMDQDSGPGLDGSPVFYVVLLDPPTGSLVVTPDESLL